MSRHERSVQRPRGVPGLEQVGHDLHSETIPLPEHSHRGTEICYLASGEVTWMVGARRLRLVGGTVSVVGPGLVHRGELDVIAPSDIYWTVFRAGELQPRPDRQSLRVLGGRRAYVARAPEAVAELFPAIMRECAGGGPGWRAAAGARLTLLALECARLAPGSSARRLEPPPEPVARAARRLAADLEHPPAVRELARWVGLGPTRFHQLFRRTFGLTPRAYLARLRLAAAREALAASGEDITALAIRLGFPSSQHFATVFKKHTGMTPSAFRKRARERGAKR
jgi:AraC-like DNA-binding protein